MDHGKMAKELIEWETEFVRQFKIKNPQETFIKQNGTPNLSNFLKNYLDGKYDKEYESAFGL